MKKLILSTVLLLTISIAHAEDANSPSQSQKATATVNGTRSDSTATNQGVTGNNVTFTSPNDVISRVEYSGTQTIKNTPSVSGPMLTTSNDTCMGSTSGSLNIAGLGLGGGSTWVDTNCKRLKNSRELWNMGMKAASLALMCNDKENMEALELTGFTCPQTARKNSKATEKTAINTTNNVVGEEVRFEGSKEVISSFNPMGRH
jgi:hypothetical protein